MQTLPGPIFDEPVFQEGKPTPDPESFRLPHPSDDEVYAKLGDLLETQTCRFDESRAQVDALFAVEDLFGAAGPDIRSQITKAGKIVFHAVGDTGASTEKSLPNELSVADAMCGDFALRTENDRPLFFFHLGDVVYNFGEAKYYYDQFYEPFRNYPRPILAIPGNHDSFIVPSTPAADTPLEVFERNFCSTEIAVAPEAGSLHRTATTLPGVYFTLDAPFVRIISLFSNALEDPGVISSEKGTWTQVPDIQLDFLRAQLNQVRNEKYSGAVLLAMHHPPFVYETNAGSPGTHGCSLAMLKEIDEICAETGFYPHAILSGHSHNYQRFTRKITFAGREIAVPFIVCGCGGHNVTPLTKSKKDKPAFGSDVSYLDNQPGVKSQGLTLENYNVSDYGYLIVEVDTKTLTLSFQTTKSADAKDQVIVDLTSQLISPN